MLVLIVQFHLRSAGRILLPSYRPVVVLLLHGRCRRRQLQAGVVRARLFVLAMIGPRNAKTKQKTQCRVLHSTPRQPHLHVVPGLDGGLGGLARPAPARAGRSTGHTGVVRR